MNTNLKTYFSALLLLSLLSSCEDKIDIPLDEADTLIVVDAFVNTNQERQIIKLSKTQSYFDSSESPAITGATVSIANQNNDVFFFNDMGDGSYASADDILLGSTGDQMTLNIEAEGKSLSSTVIIGRSPEIDEIRQVESEDIFRDSIYMEFFARDFTGLDDTYWIKSFRNGVYLNKPEEINIAYDATFDGGSGTDGLIFIPPIRELINPFDTIGWAAGDICRVEIHSITTEVFLFMELARDQLLNGNNGIFAEPLANSDGNIINHTDDQRILGAFCVSEITFLEKEIE